MFEQLLFFTSGFFIAALVGITVGYILYRRAIKRAEQKILLSAIFNRIKTAASPMMEQAVLAAENARMTIELRQKHHRLIKETIRNARLSDKMIKMRHQNEELRINVDNIKEETGHIRADLRATEINLENKQKSFRSAQENIREKEQEILSLTNKTNQLSNDIGSLKVDLADMETNAENYKSTINALRGKQIQMNNDYMQLEDHVQKTRNELKNEKKRANDLLKRLDIMNKHLSNRSQSLDNKMAEIKTLKEQIKSAKTNASELKKSLRHSELKKRAAERQLSKAQKQIAQHKSQPVAQNNVRKDKSQQTVPKNNSKNNDDIMREKNAMIKKAVSEIEIDVKLQSLEMRYGLLIDQLKKQNTPDNDIKFRLELAEIAAMMIDLTIAREGKESAIKDILNKYVPDKTGQHIQPSLANRAIQYIENTNTPFPQKNDML